MTPDQYVALHHPSCDLLAVSYGGDLLYLRRRQNPGPPGTVVTPEQAFAVRLKWIGEYVT
jgi:hypothetical protein